MAEMGPMLQTALRLFGYGGAQGGRTKQIDDALAQAQGEQPAPAAPQQMFRAPGAPVPVAQLNPEQRADWQAVGLGQMKTHEFRQKHGFLPQ